MPLQALAQDFWPLFLLSMMVGAAVFPLALLCSGIYGYLTSRFEKTPKILLFLVVTLLGTLLAITAAYLYLDATFSELARQLP